MKKLQELKQQDDIFLYLYLNDEFNKLNICLSEEQLDSLVDQLTQDMKSISLNLSIEQLIDTKYCKEEDTEVDVFRILNTIDNFAKFIDDNKNNADQKIVKLADKFATDRLRHMYEQTPEYVIRQQQGHADVEKNIDDNWGYALDWFELLITSAQEISANLDVTKINNYQENQDLYDALRRLHGRSCLIAYEILTLLRAGFADGAYARFRTIHETVIIGCFISNNGNDAAKRYLDHSHINSAKEAMQFNKYADVLGEESISNDKMLKFEEEKQFLINKYGENFAKGDYGWASSFINQKKSTFRDIEESVDFSYMRPHYKSASNNIHTGSSSLYAHLALPNDHNNQILMGASDYGIGLPCNLTSKYLLMMTTNLLLHETQTLEQTVQGILLGKISDKIKEVLFET